jgi:hypothetical protein
MIDSVYKLFLDELKFIEEASYFASQSMKNQDDCGAGATIEYFAILSGPLLYSGP